MLRLMLVVAGVLLASSPARASPHFKSGPYFDGTVLPRSVSRRANCSPGKYSLTDCCSQASAKCDCALDPLCPTSCATSSVVGTVVTCNPCTKSCNMCTKCEACPAGKSGQNEVCTDCAAGKYADVAGVSVCTSCSSGTYSTVGATSCLDVDECLSSPCGNGATCTNSNDKFECACVPGWSGDQCLTNVDECTSNPCQNGATCIDQLNAYLCVCVLGFTGTHCDGGENQCDSNPCLNGGVCTDGSSAFSCACVPGFTGATCDVNIDECASAPCLHDGTCTDNVNGFTCNCVVGYLGDTCEINVDDCLQNLCQNGATCVDAVNAFQCMCVSGFDGVYCSEDVDECASSPCENGATCVDKVGRFSCTCAPGFSGTACAINVDECASNPCQNGATCVDGINGYTCACPSSWFGLICDLSVDECESSPCHNSAVCVDVLNGYVCSCVAGYAGILCEINVDECASSPCLNGAPCHDLINSFSCLCLDGYTGVQCETNIDECASSPCLNGGLCNDLENSYSCACDDNYYGTECAHFNDCFSAPCQNGATCTDEGESYECMCAAGYDGDQCQVNIDECASSPCTNGGVCTDEDSAYACSCPQGFLGIHCETDFDECASTPCQNGAPCSNLPGAFFCDCTTGWYGKFCEVDTNECASSPCTNGAQCVNAQTGYACSCVSGYTGIHCQQEINECSSSPCSNGATCLDGADGFSCVCASGFVGVACEAEENECKSSPCSNGATCFDNVDGFACLCAAGYTGLVCHDDLDECESSPCTNGGVCSDVANAYSCACSSGFTGVDCETNVAECESSPCSNGASCVDGVDEYLCVCASGFTGVHCESNVDECASSPCQHGGTCTDTVGGFVCACHTHVEGPLCDSDCRPVSLITTQDRLNRFHGCTYTRSDLTVSGSAITSLAGLNSLTYTDGSLRIENTLATSVFIDNLVTVHGSLEIVNNANAAIMYSSSLTTIDEHLTVSYMPLLASASLSALSAVGASPLTLSNLPLLDGASLDTLSKVPFAGAVTIENTGATSLALLGGSTAITHLTVSSNAALATLAGWESAATNLFSELASLSIDDNSALTSFTCPSLLFRFASTVSISISRNRALTTLDCSFATLTAASTVLLADDTSLTTLSGFHALTHASSVTLSNSGLVSVNELAFASLHTADLIISDNAKLLSLEASGFALALLITHTGSLTISGNDVLTSVGFNGLVTLQGSLTIHKNPRLVDLSGFQALTTLSGSLIVSNNTYLSTMTMLHATNDLLTILGAFVLTHNADLCVTEVESALGDTLAVSGTLTSTGTAQDGSPPCLLHALRNVVQGGVETIDKADETVSKLGDLTNGNGWTSIQDAESASNLILNSLTSVLGFVQNQTSANETAAEISNRTLSVLDNILSPSSVGVLNSGNSSSNRIASVVEGFVGVLETIAICDGDALALHGTNLNVEVQRRSNSSALGLNYGDGSIVLPNNFEGAAHLTHQGCLNLQFIAYSTSPFVSANKNASTTSSNVVSFSVRNATVSGLTNETGILVTLTHTESSEETLLACVFWDESTKEWSTEGVTMVSQTDTQTVCRTLHLTNFAMLAMPSSKTPSLGSGATKALTVLTYLGCCASLVGIVFIWLTYYLVPSFRSHAIKLLLHLSVMLFMLNITFLAGIDATGNSIGCSFVAVFLYFLLMAAFAWMLAISHNLYFLVVRVIGEPTSVMRYAVVCYCVPLAMTLVLLIVDLCTDSAVGLGDANRCWISSDLGLYLAVLLPIACVILVNLIVFVRATRALLNSGPKHHKSMYPKRTRENPSQSVGVQRSSTLLSRTSTFLSRSTTRNTTRNKNYPKRPVQHDPSTHFKAIKLASGLLTSLGLAWIIAFVALATNEPVFWYFFVVLNASQGLLLAIFFVFLGRARKDLVKKLNLHNPMTALRRQFTTLSSPGSTRSSATALTTGASSSTLVPNGKRVQRGSVPVAKQKPLEPKRSGAWVSDGAFASQASVVMQMDDDDDDLRAVDEMEMEQMNQHAAGYSEVEMAQMHTMLSTDELDMTIVPAAVMLQDHELRAYVTPEEHETVEDSHFDDGSIFDAFSDCGSSDDLLGGDRSVPMSPIAVTRMRMAISRGSVGQSNESLSPSPSPATSSPALFSPIPPRQMSRLMAPSNANVWQSPASLISSADADGDDRSLDDGMLLRDHGDHSAGLQRNMSVRL